MFVLVVETFSFNLIHVLKRRVCQSGFLTLYQSTLVVWPARIFPSGLFQLTTACPSPPVSPTTGIPRRCASITCILCEAG